MVSRPGLIVLLIALLSAAPQLVTANCDGLYEKQAIRWIVTDAPGTYLDSWSEALGEAYTRVSKSKLELEHRVGELGRNPGVRIMNDAFPDGTTLGTVRGESLVQWLLADLDYPPDWAAKFDIIGNLYHRRLLWVAGVYTGILSVDDLAEIGRQRPVTVLAAEDDHVGRLNVRMIAELLDIPIEFTAENPYATVEFTDSSGRIASFVDRRGRTPDFAVRDVEEIWPEVEAGTVVPILQINDSRTSFKPQLVGVHSLTGENSLSSMLHPDDEQWLSRATATMGLSTLGVLVVAPAGLTNFHLTCMRQFLTLAQGKRPLKRLAHRQDLGLYSLGSRQTIERVEAIVENGPWVRGFLDGKP